MFESAELGHAIAKEEYAKRVPALREGLLSAQMAVLDARKFPALVLVNGVEGAGKGETAHVLSEWLDARHIITHAFGEKSDEESSRPAMWRFWRALPPKGKTGLFFGSWYTDPIVGRALGRLKRPAFEDSLDRIVALEEMLAAEGVELVKLWFHIPKAEQKKRFKAFERDEATRWRVTPRDWDFHERYDEFRSVSEQVIRRTSTGSAPWHVIEGTDPRYRYVTAATLVKEAMERGLARAVTSTPSSPAPAAVPTAASTLVAVDGKSILRGIDLSVKVAKTKYERRLLELQGELNMLSRHKRMKARGVVAVFEGVDAAGKGGAIRRVAHALDVRSYQIVPVAAPTEEERAQPYLWRFWRHLPRRGKFTIFDRSWYGRVLVERVEGFAAEAAWRRAYAEINEFERQLHEGGLVVCKFWLQISEAEQLRRFEERQATGFKQYKITDEDWRNRAKWGAYEVAASEMIERTSTEDASWTLVAAEDKYAARVAVLEALVGRLERALA
jgi:polyphosphate:AMP phosphotransferase